MKHFLIFTAVLALMLLCVPSDAFSAHRVPQKGANQGWRLDTLPGLNLLSDLDNLMGDGATNDGSAIKACMAVSLEKVSLPFTREAMIETRVSWVCSLGLFS